MTSPSDVVMPDNNRRITLTISAAADQSDDAILDVVRTALRDVR